MRRFLHVFIHPATLAVVGAIALAAFLFMGAALLDIDPRWAAAVFGVLVLLWLLAWGLRRWHSRRAGRVLADELEKQVEAGAAATRSADPARKAEIEDLRRRLVEAVRTIRRSRLGQHAGGEALYELPWYMVIGNPSAGKSTAIRHSGLQFPFAGQGSGPAVQGIGGTRDCDWFFTTEGILLDTAGRYAIQNEDRREWLGFLDLLRRYRPRAPINGIIVTASIPELMAAESQFAIDMARGLRLRMQELTERLEIIAPVYVMFTKADRITGFAEFFGDGIKAERDRVWGASLPYDPGEQHSAVAQFDQRFGELCAGLKEMSVAHIASRPQAQATPELLSFPLEFAAIGPVLRAFLATLFEGNPFQHKPVFRGFYFTSALQEGAVDSLAAQRIAARFGLAAPAQPEAPRDIYSHNGFFLRDLFSKVIFADRRMVRRFASPAKARWRHAAFLACVLLFGLALGGWAWSYLGNRQLVAGVEADLQKIARLRGSTGLQARLEAMGILQDRIEQLHRFREDRPLSVSLGLYQGNRLEDKLVAEYYAGLRQLMLDPLGQNLQAFLKEVNARPDQLRPLAMTAPVQAVPAAASAPRTQDGLYAGASPAEVQDAYNALKTYLMLSDKRHVEAAHLSDQIPRFWRGWLEAQRGDMPRQALIRDAERMIGFYLSRVADDNWPVLHESDLALVEQTRDNLRRVVRGMPARERVYADIKARAATRYAPMTVARILGEGGAPADAAVAGSVAISGAFTREAWSGYVDAAIRDAAHKESSSRDWVLDVAANDDLTLEGSPEQVRKALLEMYKAEYAREWRRFVQGIAVRDLGGFEQAVEAMNRLGDVQESPIRRVMETVHAQTSWDNPGVAGAALRQAGEGAANWFRRLLGRANPTRVNVDVHVDPAALAGQPPPMGPVGREFAGVARIVAQRDGGSLLQGYLGQLSRLRTRFNQIRNQGDPGPGARQLVQQTLEGSGSELADALRFVDEQMLTGMETGQRQALRPLLVRPLLQAYAAALQPAAIELNKVWQAQVHQLFQQSLAGKYPFAAQARVEAAPAEIAQVFGPEGAIGRYVANTLGPLVIRRGDLLSAREWGEVGLRLQPDFVAGFAQWVAPLRGGAAGSGGAVASQAQTLFQILPQPSPGLTEYLIEIDGQQLRYRNTPPQWTNFVWPHAQGAPGARISAVGYDGRSVELVNEPGNFGLEKLIGTAQRVRQPDGSFELSWSREGAAVMVRLRVVQSPQTGGADAPQGAGLRGAVLPASVVELARPQPAAEERP